MAYGWSIENNTYNIDNVTGDILYTPNKNCGGESSYTVSLSGYVEDINITLTDVQVDPCSDCTRELVMWFNDEGTNTSYDKVLSDSSAFIRKNVDECTQIVFTKDPINYPFLCEKSQTFDYGQYTDSGHPIIYKRKTDGSIDQNQIKYVNGTTYNGHKIKYTLMLDDTQDKPKATIPSGCLSGSTGITEIYFPSCVDKISAYAFTNCQNLSAITMTGVEEIGEFAFCCLDLAGRGQIGLLKEVVFTNEYPNNGDTCNQYDGDGIKSIGMAAFAYSSIEVVDLSNETSLTILGESQFHGCTNLRMVKLPNSLEEISVNAFTNCSSLTSITIPNSVTSISNEAFYNCKGLTSVTIPNSVTSIGERAFRDCDGLTSVTIGNGVTSIGDSAFYNCTNLTSVNIPNSVTNIGSSAFSSCSGLTNIVIPNSVTSIGNNVFDSCTNLTSIVIPNSVTNIGDAVFYQCSSLTSVDIPNSVTSIGNAAFHRCSSLTSVTVNATTPPTLGTNAFANTPNNLVIYVPSASVDAYKAASGWSSYASRIQAIQ